jgi:hypothetical protein
MARRIKAAAKGYILLNGNLVDINKFKTISKNTLDPWNDPNGRIKWSIEFTPEQTVLENENNNVDGTWYITYTEDEKKDFEKDYKEILESQKTEKWVTVKNIIKYIIIPLGFAVFSWWIEKNI